MPITVLDPRAALIVVDLQKGIAGNPLAAPVVEKAAQLADGFRAADLPVVLVNVDGAPSGRTDVSRPPAERPDDWTEVLPALGDGIRVTKKTWGAFHGTGLDGILRDRGVTQVVVVGIATSMGVESTARAAREHDYNVVIVTDAVADMSPENHEHAIGRIFPLIAETGTTADVLALLGERNGSSPQ